MSTRRVLRYPFVCERAGLSTALHVVESMENGVGVTMGMEAGVLFLMVKLGTEERSSLQMYKICCLDGSQLVLVCICLLKSPMVSSSNYFVWNVTRHPPEAKSNLCNALWLDSKMPASDACLEHQSPVNTPLLPAGETSYTNPNSKPKSLSSPQNPKRSPHTHSKPKQIPTPSFRAQPPPQQANSTPPTQASPPAA